VGGKGPRQAFGVSLSALRVFVFVLNALNWTLPAPFFPLFFPFPLPVVRHDGFKLWFKIVTRSFIEGLFNECLYLTAKNCWQEEVSFLGFSDTTR